MMIRLIATLLLIQMLSACATMDKNAAPEQPSADKNAEPVMAKKLPDTHLKYQYSGFQNYDNDLGFSLRYVKEEERGHYADIYVWDSPSQMAKLPHKEVVYNMTVSAIQEIKLMEERGHYSNVAFIERLAFEGDGHILTKHKFSMMRGNLAILSFLYITEFKGHLIKARVTLPDNKFNRSREDVQQFVTDIFDRIIVAVDTIEAG